MGEPPMPLSSRRAVRWSIAPLLLLTLATAARADTLVSTGILGNSGEQGATLIRFADAGSRKGAIGGGSAVGMGVAADRFGGLWDRGGPGLLNRYAADGRLLGQYPLPKGASGSDQLTLVGDTLVLQVQGKLYTLDVSAAPGTEPTPLGRDSQCISFGSANGAIASVLKGRLTLVNPKTKAVTEVGDIGDASQVELGPDGAVYAAAGSKVRKYVGGKEVTEGWPRGGPGERMQLLDGSFFGHAWHGTIRRFTADLEPDPGVVLGGASGSFIGHLDQNSELSNARGMAKVRENLYAASGFTGVLHLVAWDPARRQMRIVRRIGAVPYCTALALDRAGNVWWHLGAWAWADGPATPIEHGVNAPDELAQPAMLPGDRMAAAGWLWGKPAFYHGPLSTEVKGWHIEKAAAMMRSAIACAAYRQDNRLRLLAIDAAGKAACFNIGDDGAHQGDGGPVTLAPAQPVKQWTSLATKDDTTLLAGADGFVLELKFESGAWKETRRWNSWAGGDPFGPSIRVACDAGRIWVTDRDRHRVCAFDAATGKLLATFGKAGAGLDELTHPETIAARGDRAVVYDSGNQRLVKLEWRR